MKFTIAIPTRNRAELLRRALKSALNQDYDDYEIVVSNNASSDDTEEVISQLMEDRIRYFKTDHPMSMVDHWNYVMDKIGGEWVLYLCDDDALPSFTLSYLDRVTKQYPDIEVIQMLRAEYVYPDMNVSEANCLIIPSIPDEHVEILSSRDALVNAYRVLSEQIPKIHNSFIRRSLLERIKLQFGKVFFDWYPDVSNGLLILANTAHYAYLHQVLRVWGENKISYGPGSRTNPKKLLEFLNEFDDFEGHFPFSPYPDLFVITNGLYDTYCGVCELLADQASGLQVDQYTYRRRLLRDIQRYIDMGFEDYRKYHDVVSEDIKEFSPEPKQLSNTTVQSKPSNHSVQHLLRKIIPRKTTRRKKPKSRQVIRRQIIYGSDSDPKFEDIYEATLYLNKHYKPPS